MNTQLVEEVKELKAKFAGINTLCDGSDIINRWQQRIVKVFGIIAAHIENSYTAANPLRLDSGDPTFSAVFADKVGAIEYHWPDRETTQPERIEINRDNDRGKNTLPVSLLVPVVRALPDILKNALKESIPLRGFMNVCDEVVELDEASHQAEADEAKALAEARALDEREKRADAKLNAIFGGETTLGQMLDMDRGWEDIEESDRYGILMAVFEDFTPENCAKLSRMPLSFILNVVSVDEGRKLIARGRARN